MLQEIFFLTVGLSAQVFFTEILQQDIWYHGVKFLHEKSICLCYRNPKIRYATFLFGFCLTDFEGRLGVWGGGWQMQKSRGSSETAVGTPSDKAGKLQHELGLDWPRSSH